MKQVGYVGRYDGLSRAVVLAVGAGYRELK